MTVPHKDLANAVRFLAVDAIEKSYSGHPGMPMGMADVATVLFRDFLSFNPEDPHWPNRDRFVLSAGHGSMLLYSLLYLTGYKAMTLEQLKQFRQFGSLTPGHPEYGLTDGVEVTTGPLGQGIGNAVGMALAERTLLSTFGSDLIDHYTYVIAGDGCLMEGISQEALSFAGHQKLDKLIILFDNNGITIDGATDLTTSDNHLQRFEASGWHTSAIDGHDPEAIKAAIHAAKKSDKPSLIACKTIIGYGAPKKAGTEKTHGSPLGPDETTGMRAAFNWPYAPLETPENILSAWRGIGEKSQSTYVAWGESLQQKPSDMQAEFTRRMRGRLPKNWANDFFSNLKQGIAIPEPISTRRSLQEILDVLAPTLPELVGGSADLTGSNNTKGTDMLPMTPQTPTGTYIHYGIREHAMGAIMNGLSVDGGFIPYGGTFLVFSDYCRPAIRLAALMGIRVIFVMTHDSIGVGEDGPTHQPIEHLMSLRLIPNLTVLRPADLVETAECWQVALEKTDGPSLLALTRQTLPALNQWRDQNLSKRGGYVLKEANGTRHVTLVATGSEVSLALEVQETLENSGVKAAVISMPSTTLFDQQDAVYQKEVLGEHDHLKVAIEAGRTRGWEPYVGSNGLIIGLDDFGMSAPASEIYAHFGLTASKISETIQTKLKIKETK